MLQVIDMDLENQHLRVHGSFLGLFLSRSILFWEGGPSLPIVLPLLLTAVGQGGHEHPEDENYLLTTTCPAEQPELASCFSAVEKYVILLLVLNKNPTASPLNLCKTNGWFANVFLSLYKLKSFPVYIKFNDHIPFTISSAKLETPEPLPEWVTQR